MSSNEYGEPWHVELGILASKEEGIIASNSDWGEPGDRILERIAACVNACAGIPTDQLQSHVERELKA